MAVGLEATNNILRSSLFVDPMPPMVAMLAIFNATLDSLLVALKNKVQVTKVGNYLAKRLTTIAALVDKSMPFHKAREEGGEGRARPSCLVSPVGLPKESR